MKITFAPKGIVQIDDARIIFRNLSGEGSKYNREGDRNFSLLIDNQEVADALIDAGWNVRIKPPREEGEAPFMHLPVKVKFNDRGPNVYLRTGDKQISLNERTVGMLDRVDIRSVDLDIRPYDWERDGETGRSAYLHSMRVYQEVDRFAERFAEEEYPDELPSFDRF